jgi:alpha-beta hydrolase superfamily lysophospholipase
MQYHVRERRNEMATESTFTLKDLQGFEIFVYKWLPPPGLQPKAVVQIAHGAAEHALRYECFALALNDAGYVVYANDHRGHGKTAGTLDKAGMLGVDGMDGQRPGPPTTSARKTPACRSSCSAGMVFWPSSTQTWGRSGCGHFSADGSLGDNLPQTIAASAGDAAKRPERPSTVFGMMFLGFNAPFEPIKTGFEWLSCDEAEVQKYVDDPWCGFPSPTLVADMFKGRAEDLTPESEARIPTEPAGPDDLNDDPVGGFGRGEGARRATRRWASGPDCQFYEGDRHELLNETTATRCSSIL